MTLDEVLIDNPFTEEIVSGWKDDLEKFNSGQKERSDLDFVLKGDQEWVAAIGENFIYKNLLPVPFQGNPTAPVWFIPMNPSYSKIDLYDNLGICPDCERSMINAGSHHDSSCMYYHNSDWLKHDGNPRKSLEDRQIILLNQLRLNDGNSFAFLEKAFDVLQNVNVNKGKGGYRWWQKYAAGRTGLLHFFGGDAQLAGKKLFVLETFPYHSGHFNDSYYSEHVNKSAYFGFWKKLVKWGVEQGKKFILRPTGEMFKAIVNESQLGLSSDNTVCVRNIRSPWVSHGNLSGEEKTISEICCLLRDR